MRDKLDMFDSEGLWVRLNPLYPSNPCSIVVKPRWFNSFLRTCGAYGVLIVGISSRNHPKKYPSAQSPTTPFTAVTVENEPNIGIFQDGLYHKAALSKSFYKRRRAANQLTIRIFSNFPDVTKLQNGFSCDRKTRKKPELPSTGEIGEILENDTKMNETMKSLT